MNSMLEDWTCSLLDRNAYTKGKGVCSLSARVLLYRPIIVKSWENIVGLILKVPVRNQGLLLHKSSIFFESQKLAPDPRLPSVSCRTLRITLFTVFFGIGLEYLPILPAFSGLLAYYSDEYSRWTVA